MNKQNLLSLIVTGALMGGAQAAGPDLDLSQPPDPQPAAGPTGDGEDWEGDGTAPLIDDAVGAARKVTPDQGASDSSDTAVKKGKSSGQGKGEASSGKGQ